MWWAPLLDVAVVVLFVAIGRDTHDEGTAVSAIAATAAPFLIALALGTGLARMRRPATSPAAGVIVWGATLAVGMLLRRTVFEEGTAFSFVLVATVFLGGGMLGWRLIWSKLTIAER